MAEVFISYSKAYRHETERLAAALQERGHSVWWDASLLPVERFRDAILRELDAAKAAIVIWSPSSVKSDWVISEASRASEQNKLIQLRTRDLAVNRIPPPFGVIHCSDVDDRVAIFNALARLGVGAGATADDRPAPWSATKWLVGAAAAVFVAVTGAAAYLWLAPPPTPARPAWVDITTPASGERGLLPAGYVDMGDGQRTFVDEFVIYRTVVTVGDFEKFTNDTGYHYPVARMRDCNYGKPESTIRPMNCVTWEDADAFAKWARMELPTERELRRAKAEADLAKPNQSSPVFIDGEEWLHDWFSPPGKGPYEPGQGVDRTLLKVKSGAGNPARVRDVPSAGRSRPEYMFRVVLRKPPA